MGKKQNPLSARVKRMMQADVEVGKIAGPTPVLISKALEIFLKELCDGASEIAVQRQARTMLPGHLKQYVMHAQRMDFLKDKFAEVADLPDHVPGAAPANKPKAKKRPRNDAPTALQVSKASKEAKDTPVIHPIPDSTPFTAPPTATSGQAPVVMNSATEGSCALQGMGSTSPAASVPAAGSTKAAEFTKSTQTAAGQPGAQLGAAQAVFAAPAAAVSIMPQGAQPVAAEEDDYDAD